MKRTTFFLLSAIILLFLGCDGFLKSPSAGNDTISIDKIPVFSSSSIVVPGSRSVLPNDIELGDIFYTLLAPPITKFESPSEAFSVGDSVDIEFLSKTLTLASSLTEEGMIKMAGPIIEKDKDNKDLETGKIEIIYDKENSKFSYYSEILILDPNEKIGVGMDGHMYVIQEIPFTKIEADNSFLANFTTLAYLKYEPDELEVQLIDAGELYSGPDGSDWIVGFATSSFKALYSDDFPILGIVHDSLGILANDQGVPIASSDFAEIRTNIVAARDLLFTKDGKIGNPLVGYRRINSEGLYGTKVYSDANSTDGGVHLCEIATGNELTDIEGNAIVFPSDGKDPPRVVIDEESINLLISGLPNEDWQARTTLKK